MVLYLKPRRFTTFKRALPLVVLLYLLGPFVLSCGGGGDEPTESQGGGECSDNSGCDLGEVCDAGSCRTARCDRGDIQCASGEICDAGRCRQKRCDRGDIQCASDEVCEPSSGQCKACDPLIDENCGGGGGGGTHECNDD